MSVLSARLCHAGDVRWVVRRLLIVTGLRRPVPRPVLLQSHLAPSASDRSANIARSSQQVPKVLVFSHNLNREGAPISLKELVAGLVERDEVHAEVYSYADGPLRAEYEALGISVKVLPQVLRKLSTLKRVDDETSSLAGLLQESGAQVVLANTLLNFPAVLAAEKAGIPSVWNPRESEPWNQFFQFLADPVAQRAIAAMGLPRRVVFVAQATRDVWQEFESECRFSVVHNALNPTRFARWLEKDRTELRRALCWGQEDVVFLCTGTVCARKGQADAIEALACIAQRLQVPVRLVLVGDSSLPYAVRLKRLAIRWRRAGRVRVEFVDATADIGQFYRASDVFMLCSRVESYPRVVLEALAFGLPIITTRVFGVAEQLPDPCDALFYEPSDVPRLAEHMLELASRPASRESFARRSRLAHGRMASFEEMCQSYARILRDAAGA